MTDLKLLLSKYCPDGVSFCSLENCCVILDNKRKPVTKSVRVSGEYPYYGANGVQDYVSDYIFDGVFVLVGEDGSVMTEHGTPVVHWVEGKIWANNHVHVIGEVDGVLLRYLYHFLQTVYIRDLVHGNIPKLTQGDFKSIQIPVPPLPVQHEIVRILDKFTELTAELTAELDARKKQYEFYRDKILSFDAISDLTHQRAEGDVSRQFTKLEQLLLQYCLNGVEYKRLGDVFLRLKGTPITANQMKEIASDDGDIRIFAGGKTVVDAFESDIPNVNVIRRPAVLVQSRGVIDFVYYTKPFTFKNEMWAYAHAEDVSVKYLYHVLKNNVLYFQTCASGKGSMPQISLPVTDDFQIPFPPLPVQEYIVEILDRFDTLCNDITTGLPAEIAARQKQYEYYRDKLLTFERKA